MGCDFQCRSTSQQEALQDMPSAYVFAIRASLHVGSSDQHCRLLLCFPSELECTRLICRLPSPEARRCRMTQGSLWMEMMACMTTQGQVHLLI